MDRLLFKSGELRLFIVQVQAKMEMDSEKLAKLTGVSGRTVRDWRREKFNPTKEHIEKMSELSGITIPEYKILSSYWYVKRAARLGGKRTFELYGLLGTKESRSKGGKSSWLKRKNNPELWNKYTNTILRPEESVDLAEFIGIMLGDGGMTRFQCVIYLNSDTDQEFAHYVCDLVEKLFGLKAAIYKSKREKVWRVSISGVNLVEYLKLKGLSIGNKVHLQVEVPPWIWAKSEYIKACIRGLIDTDGCFALHRYKVNGTQYCYPKICFTNRSEPILDFVDKGLKQLGFNPKRTFMYEVWLHRHSEARKYLEEIGTRNYRPNVKKILEGGPDGKAQVC
mgnify:CR=1 FL=1